MKYILALSVFLVANAAFAQDELACSDIHLKESEIGTTCITSKGGLFKRVKFNGELAIQDLREGGRIWMDAIGSEINQSDAEKLCRSKGLLLPSGYPRSENGKNGGLFASRDSDFVLAESRGIREAFHESKMKYFWSSSVDDKKNIAYYFDGSFDKYHPYPYEKWPYGWPEHNIRYANPFFSSGFGIPSNVTAARCVSRRTE